MPNYYESIAISIKHTLRLLQALNYIDTIITEALVSYSYSNKLDSHFYKRRSLSIAIVGKLQILLIQALNSDNFDVLTNTTDGNVLSRIGIE